MTTANGNEIETVQEALDRARRQKRISGERTRPQVSTPPPPACPSVPPAMAGPSEPPPIRSREFYLTQPPTTLREAELAKTWRASRLPQRHLEAIDEVLATASGPWLAEYERMVGELPSGFITALVGPFGGGKTQLAVCVAAFALDHGLSVRYYRAMDFFRESRACFNDPKRNEQEFAALHEKLGLLIIDEAHERGGSEYEDRMLGNILDRRYAGNKPTILISNESVEKFAQGVGGAVIDRMKESGGIVVCNWESHRGVSHENE